MHTLTSKHLYNVRRGWPMNSLLHHQSLELDGAVVIPHIVLILTWERLVTQPSAVSCLGHLEARQ